jgi:hypothetical protein
MTYKPGTLKLALGDYAIVLDRFSDLSFPREIIEPVRINYSLAGTPLLEGKGYEAKHIWSVTAILGSTDLLTLNKIYQNSVRSRLPITLHDYTMLLSEFAPRTRALAAGAVLNPDGDAAMVSYYGQFKVFMVAEPRARMEGKYREVVITMTELDKVPA